MRFFVLVLSAVAVVQSNPVVQDESVIRLVLGNFVNCMNSDLNLCLKEHALRATERLGTVRQLKIIDGITIVNNGHKEGRSLEPLSTEPDIRNKQLTQRLWESTSELLQNSALELSYPPSDKDDSRAIDEEGRGKKKEKKQKIKMLIPIVLLGALKAVALVIFFIGVIAASLFKLAVLAKIAFVAKIVAIVKALLAKKHQQQEEQVWAHEEHGHGGGWDGGWGRSMTEAQNLAYSAYRK